MVAVSQVMVKHRCWGGLPHRIIQIQTKALVDGDRLFVSELIHLIGWMVAAMSDQEAALRGHTIQKAGYLTHMIFPVRSLFFA